MIIYKSSGEIEKMRRSSKIVAETLQYLIREIKAGVKTIELDKMAEDYVQGKGAEPAFKGYRGFPNTICTSINEEVVHGIPSKRELKEGDIISIDLGVFYDGYYGDAAVTIGVEKISQQAKKLLEITEKALYLGIEKAKEGNYLSDISHTIQTVAENNSFSVVKAFVGHGIGAKLHEAPQIPNFGPPGHGPKLKEGMVLAIEPMVNMGGSSVDVLEDNWTVVTSDRKLSAHFEHTIAITKNGSEILTRV
ncbi:MAG TPA: type I methionyl aminopeptidase [Nitrospinota bacterium]|nr:type I methionyl aminopeptidase [Nitrospinota bacterium]